MNLLIHPLPVINLDNSFEICISFGDTAIQFSPFGGTWQGNAIDPSSGIFSPIAAGMGTHKLLYSYQHPVTKILSIICLEEEVLVPLNFIRNSKISPESPD